MGGSESKTKILNHKLAIRYERLNVDELDNLYSEAFAVINDVEIIRCEFLLKWNEFVRQTGGVIYVDPKFEPCVQAMLWKLAADMNGNLSTVEIFEQDPFIVFHDKSYLKDEDIVITSSFVNLCRFYASNLERVYKIDSEDQKFDREATNLLKDPESLLTDKYNIAPMEYYAYEKKLNVNAKRIRQSYLVICEIRNTFEDIHRGLQRYSNIMKSPEQVRKLENIGLEAIQKKIFKPAKIVYKFTKEEKLSTYEDHMDIISDDLKAEKEARYILDELKPRGLINKVFTGATKVAFVQQKKDADRYNTAQTTSTIRKETEATRTGEYIPPTNIEKEVIVTETRPAYEKEITVNQIRPSYEKEITVNQIRPTYEKEITVNQTRPTYEREIPVSQVRSVSGNGNGKIGNIHRAQTQPVEFIVSDREMKPRDHIVKDLDYEQETMARIKPIKTFYDQTYSRSEIIEPEKIEKKITEKFGSAPELLTGKEKSNIDLQTGLIPKTSEYEKLQREVEMLRKENEKLSLRLSQTSFTEQPEVQTATTYVQPTPQKMPVFIRHHVPLKSWNLVFKKRVNSSENKLVKSVEPAIDLDYIITGLKNGKLIFWKFTNFASIFEHKVMSISDSPVKALMYLNDGKTLICGCKDGKLMKCDVNLFSIKNIVELPDPIVAIVNPLNGFSIFVASGRRIYEIDIINNKIYNSIEAHDLPITDLAYNQQKEIMCSSGKDKSVKVWSATTKECLGILQGHADTIKSICFAYTTEHLVLASVALDSYITFWNLTDKSLTKSLKMNSPAEKVIYLWDKNTMLTTHKKGVFTLWNIDTDEAKEFPSENSQIKYSNCCYFDDGHNIILTSDVGNLEFWNAK